VTQQTFSRMREDEGFETLIGHALYPDATREVGREAARRVVRLWNQTLHLSTDAIEGGEFLHLSKVDAWVSLSLNALSAWLGALRDKNPQRDVHPGAMLRVATLLSEAQRALEEEPVALLPEAQS